MEQVHIQLPCLDPKMVTISKHKNGIYSQEHEKMEATLLGYCAAHLWHHDSYRAICPRPILVSRQHLKQAEELHQALTAALTDIVQRWWTDGEAGLPEKMPLEPQEEELLKWLEIQVSSGNLPVFTERLGSWRPDFLVEDLQCGQSAPFEENFSITEINARYSFNGFMHGSMGQQAIDEVLDEINVDLVSAASASAIFNGLFDLFRNDLPLHLLKGEEDGIDIHMFIDAAWRCLGIKPRLIKPGDLRLVPDTHSKTGYKLYCIVYPGAHDAGGVAVKNPFPTMIDGEWVEEIHQVGLELRQHELKAMTTEMLHEVSLRCFNDLRTILLIHDKRMLGVIKDELPRLVARKTITPTQAAVLDRGIVDTLIPGSPALHDLLQASKCSSELKNGYLIKPIRGGKGIGIVFGEDLSHIQWIEILERLQCPKLGSGVSYVVQRRIIPRMYNLALKRSGEIGRFPLVGTYHVVNGKFLGIGTWRTNNSRIVAISGGGSALLSVMRPT